MASQRGFTLVEMLAGLLIGLLISVAIVDFFTQSNRSYLLNESRSQVQERGRFAINLLTRDIRSSMSWGCLGQTRDEVTSHLVDDEWTSPSIKGRIFEAEATELPISVRDSVKTGTQVLKVAGFNDLGIRVEEHRIDDAELDVINTRSAEFLTINRADYLLLVDAQCSVGHLVQSAVDVNVPNAGEFIIDYSSSSELQPGNKNTSMSTDYGQSFADFDDNIDYSGRVNLFRASYYFLGQHQGRSYLKVYRPEEGQVIRLVPGVTAIKFQAGIGEQVGQLNGYFDRTEVTDWSDLRSLRVDLLIKSEAGSAPGQSLTRFFDGATHQFEDQHAEVFTAVTGIRVMNP